MSSEATVILNDDTIDVEYIKKSIENETMITTRVIMVLLGGWMCCRDSRKVTVGQRLFFDGLSWG